MTFGFLLVLLKFPNQFKHSTREPAVWVRRKPAVAYGGRLWVERGLPTPPLSPAPWLGATRAHLQVGGQRRSVFLCNVLDDLHGLGVFILGD